MMLNASVAEGACLTRRRLLLSAAVLSAMPPFAAYASGDGAADARLRAWTAGTPARLDAWMRDRLNEVEGAVTKLKAVQGARTVTNTLVHYDRARNALAMAGNQAELLANAAATPELQQTARAAVDRVAAASIQLDLDQNVYEALLDLSATDDARRADIATRRYIEQALLRGRVAGVDRSDATRATVQRLQARIAKLSTRYAQNMQQPAAIVETTVDALAGLPADFIASHPADASGVVKLTAASADVLPVLRFASDADLRRRMHVAFENRGFPANAQILADLVSARADLAQALGYDSYADLTLSDQMIASAAGVKTMLDRIEALSRAASRREAAAILAYARSVDRDAEVTAADATYWSERYRQQRYGIDGQELRAYLPFVRVLPGIVAFAARFFRLRFEPVRGDVVWHPKVIVFDVHDAEPQSKDRLLGRIYVDAHPRVGKSPIFATAPLVPGGAGQQLPEGAIICNLPGGEVGDPGLLGHSDVVNLMHEFGHLMHHVLAGQGRWAGQGAFDTEEDFLEAPSQMLEEFARDASVLQAFGQHYATDGTIPDAVIDNLNRSTAFGRAGWLRAQLQRAQFSLTIHRRAFAAAEIEVEHKTSLRALSTFPPVEGTHAYAAWPHLTGYGPNYYMYLIDKVIAVDLASRFSAADPASGGTPIDYRRKLLEPGAGRPARTLVRDFLGRDESYAALSAWMDGRSGRT